MGSLIYAFPILSIIIGFYIISRYYKKLDKEEEEYEKNQSKNETKNKDATHK